MSGQPTHPLRSCTFRRDDIAGSRGARIVHSARPEVHTEAMPADKNHDHTPEEEREIREAALDETIEDSFPASDPPSTNPNPDHHDAARRAAGVQGKRSRRTR